MTVKELISALMKVPDIHAPVLTRGYESGFNKVTNVVIEPLTNADDADAWYNGDYDLSQGDEPEDRIFKGVIIISLKERR